jgi:uncharacterized membrane protein YkvA (DUF1232 family)
MPQQTTNHAKTPLPWPPSHTAGRRQRVGDWTLQSEEVARFDELVHQIHPNAPRVDADRVAQLSRWLLALPEAQAREVLDERLSRIDGLRRMVADPNWDCAPSHRERVEKMLCYLDETVNLIPDRVPLLGKLDDVLLLELTWPALATEVDEYDDFTQYRETDHPEGSGQEQRATWIRDRLAALALVRHQQRVSDSHYVEAGRPEAPFRIGG